MSAQDEAMWAPFACEPTPLDGDACEAYVDWLRGRRASAPSGAPAALRWALVHADGGVTWGRFDGEANVWVMASKVAPELAPMLDAARVHEMRVFGRDAEVLVWRGEGGLRGRVLADASSDLSDDLRPFDEARVVRGDRLVRKYPEGFAWVADATGAEQVLPVSVDDAALRRGLVRLWVRHYFGLERATGAVRVVASRLVDLSVGSGS